MKDMEAHLEKLRVQVAESEMIRDLATDLPKRELFDRLARHFKTLAGELEIEISKRTPTDTFLGSKTHEPFPKEEEE
jgi:hypothetical protein